MKLGNVTQFLVSGSSCIDPALTELDTIYWNSDFRPWTLNSSEPRNKFYVLCIKPMLYIYFLFAKSNKQSSVLINNPAAVFDTTQHSTLTLSFLCFCNINDFCFFFSFGQSFFVSFADTSFSCSRPLLSLTYCVPKSGKLTYMSPKSISFLSNVSLSF